MRHVIYLFKVCVRSLVLFSAILSAIKFIIWFELFIKSFNMIIDIVIVTYYYQPRIIINLVLSINYIFIWSHM